jgi:hypothetical protein
MKRLAMNWPFHTDGGEEGDMIESVVTGTVVDTFLLNRAKSHMVWIKVDQDFVEGVKNLVQTVPGFQEPDFRWPFECRVTHNIFDMNGVYYNLNVKLFNQFCFQIMKSQVASLFACDCFTKTIAVTGRIPSLPRVISVVD